MSQTLAQPIELRSTPADVPKEIADLGPWFHNLHLPDGTQTCPGHVFGDFPAFKWAQVQSAIPLDLTGWTCLDIGCNAGFYTFELARRGASVLGIDLDERYLRQARWAARQMGLEGRTTFKKMQVYDLAHYDPSQDLDLRSITDNQQRTTDNSRFDLILFMGVLYHLRYPLLGLDLVAQKVNRLMLFQTLTMPGEEVLEQTWDRDMNDRGLLREAGWPKVAFFEHGFAGDYTNHWAPNHAGVEAMLRSSGMRVVGRPGHEFYLCEPDAERPSCVATWNAAELLSATGRPWQGQP